MTGNSQPGGDRWRLSYHPALNGVRAFAVLAVILSHLGIQAFNGGGAGVLVFFVLSGFLITSLLLQEREDNGWISLTRFYARRALRLFPALALVIAATVLALTLMAPDGGTTLQGLIPATFYFANWMWFAQGTDFEVLGYFGHFWSLSVEEQFYLAWPVVLIPLARTRQRALAVGLAISCAAVLVLRLVVIRDVSDGHLLFGTHMILDQLLYGALLAVLLRVAPDRVAGVTRLTVWPAFVTLGMFVVFINVQSPGLRGLLGVTVAPTIVALCSALIIGRLVTSPTASLTQALEWSPIGFIGRISYGMYLWHILVISAATQVGGGPLVTTAVALGGTTAIAAASYFYWEKPFLRLKHRFESERRGQVVGNRMPARET